MEEAPVRIGFARREKKAQLLEKEFITNSIVRAISFAKKKPSLLSLRSWGDKGQGGQWEMGWEKKLSCV